MNCTKCARREAKRKAWVAAHPGYFKRYAAKRKNVRNKHLLLKKEYEVQK